MAGSEAAYAQELEAAGFVNIRSDDVTEDWSHTTAARAQQVPWKYHDFVFFFLEKPIIISLYSVPVAADGARGRDW